MQGWKTLDWNMQDMVNYRKAIYETQERCNMFMNAPCMTEALQAFVRLNLKKTNASIAIRLEVGGSS